MSSTNITGRANDKKGRYVSDDDDWLFSSKSLMSAQPLKISKKSKKTKEKVDNVSEKDLEQKTEDELDNLIKGELLNVITKKTKERKKKYESFRISFKRDLVFFILGNETVHEFSIDSDIFDLFCNYISEDNLNLLKLYKMTDIISTLRNGCYQGLLSLIKAYHKLTKVSILDKK